MKEMKIKMSLPMVRQRIKSSGMEIFKAKRLPNDNGSAYHDGTNPEEMRSILLAKK
jgi:hypothetical protein